jgi:Ca2+-binding RTX toxin-like protein
VLGGSFADRMNGDGGNDELHGGNDSDLMSGDAGLDDFCDGGNGDDAIDEATCETIVNPKR